MERISEFKKFWRKNDIISGKKILTQSVCPNLYEKSEIKLGLLISLIGGVP